MPRTTRSTQRFDLADFARRHERGLVLAWLLGCALLVAAIGFPGFALPLADRVVRAVTHGSLDRLQRGEELVAAGRHREAAELLSQLERVFPATWVKHRYAPERERLLELLGTSLAEIGQTRPALETFERLARFDPRNWRNHFLLAEARRRLGEPQLAAQSYADVLALHPSHLGAVEALIGLKLDRGAHADVPPLYGAYLDGWLLATMTLRLRSAAARLEVPVDGRAHTVEVPLAADAGAGDELRLETTGYSVRLFAVELIGPLHAGDARAPERRLVDGDDGWSGVAATAAGPGTWSARDPAAAIVRAAPEPAVARVRVRLAAFKALTADLWERVERSYREAGDREALEAARARSVVGGCPEAGSLFAEGER